MNRSLTQLDLIKKPTLMQTNEICWAQEMKHELIPTNKLFRSPVSALFNSNSMKERNKKFIIDPYLEKIPDDVIKENDTI